MKATQAEDRLRCTDALMCANDTATLSSGVTTQDASPPRREHTGSCFVPVGSRRDRPGRHGGGGHLPLSPRRDIRQTATLWNPLNQAAQKGSTAHRPAATHDRQKSGSGIPSTQSIGEWLRKYIRGTLHLSTQPESGCPCRLLHISTSSTESCEPQPG